MGEFKKRGNFGGGRDDRRSGGGFRGGSHFGGGSKFGRGGDFKQAEMFSTTCAECHKPCEVPFRPNGEKPVYCSNCFRNKSGGSSDYPRRESSSRDFPKREFSAAPVARPQFDGGQVADLKKQLETLSSKLDRLMDMVSKNSTSQKPAEKKVDAVELAKAVNKAVAAPKKVETKVVTVAAKKVAPKKPEVKVVAKVVAKKKVAAKKK